MLWKDDGPCTARMTGEGQMRSSLKQPILPNQICCFRKGKRTKEKKKKTFPFQPKVENDRKEMATILENSVI